MNCQFGQTRRGFIQWPRCADWCAISSSTGTISVTRHLLRRPVPEIRIYRRAQPVRVGMHCPFKRGERASPRHRR